MRVVFDFQSLVCVCVHDAGCQFSVFVRKPLLRFLLFTFIYFNAIRTNDKYKNTRVLLKCQVKFTLWQKRRWAVGRHSHSPHSGHGHCVWHVLHLFYFIRNSAPAGSLHNIFSVCEKEIRSVKSIYGVLLLCFQFFSNFWWLQGSQMTNVTVMRTTWDINVRLHSGYAWLRSSGILRALPSGFISPEYSKWCKTWTEKNEAHLNGA